MRIFFLIVAAFTLIAMPTTSKADDSWCDGPYTCTGQGNSQRTCDAPNNSNCGCEPCPDDQPCLCQCELACHCIHGQYCGTWCTSYSNWISRGKMKKRLLPT